MLIKCFTCVYTLEKTFTYNKITFSCINDRITKINTRDISKNQLVESFFVCGSGYECVCVCVNAARLSFIYSALTIPLHQMGTNRVRGERGRKRDTEREETEWKRGVGDVCPMHTAMRTPLFPVRPLLQHDRGTQAGCKISLKKRERDRPQEGLRSH